MHSDGHHLDERGAANIGIFVLWRQLHSRWKLGRAQGPHLPVSAPGGDQFIAAPPQDAVAAIPQGLVLRTQFRGFTVVLYVADYGQIVSEFKVHFEQKEER